MFNLLLGIGAEQKTHWRRETFSEVAFEKQPNSLVVFWGKLNEKSHGFLWHFW